MLKKARKFDKKKLNDRTLYIAIILWVALAVLVGRYGWLQIVRGDEYAERTRIMASDSGEKQSPRGRIVDRNGRELAISRMTKSLYVNPNNVKDPDAVAAALAPIIDVPEAEIKEKIADGGEFAWLKRRMEVDQENAVRQIIKDNMWNRCLNFQDEVKRYYPNDMLAANVLGFVGIDDKGLDGIEQECDSLIKGTVDEKAEISGDAEKGGETILSSLIKRKKYNGDRRKEIVLTLDATAQFIVEQALDKAMLDHTPKSVTALVMDPRNGEIIAMASRPSYNPNKYWDYPNESWRNRAVSFIYEPGSTFKAVVAGIALQEKVVAPNQYFEDPGYVMVSERRIQNWNGSSFGTVSFADVVKNSINTSFALIGLQIGGKTLTEYAKLFGFGEYTGIALPGEEAGILFDPEEMRASDVATMSIGQSIAVTPLQLITAMSSIANDGILLKPQIIKEINNPDGSTYKKYGREEVRRVIESATDKTLVGLLEQVVSTGGGGKAAVKGYRIAGKTGTAQKIREDGAGYLDGRYIASFCGFAPVENPQLTVLVIIDDPVGEFYGGQIAAPIAKEIFTNLFRYFHIEPTSDPFTDNDLNISVQPEPLLDTTTAYKEPPPGKASVPYLSGCSIREASQKLEDCGLSISVHGSGVATGQDLSPNTAVDLGTVVTVYFSN